MSGKTTLVCDCGRKHTVPVTLSVKDKNELERENAMLKARISQLKNWIKELADKI